MTFVPFADTVRAAIRYDADGTIVVNTLWFRNLAGVTLSSAEDLADQLDLWASGVIMPILCVGVDYLDVTVYDMTSPDSFVVVNDDNTGSSGEDVGAILPLNCAMTVTFQTARRGRSYRGRNYLCGFTEPTANHNRWTTGIQADVAAAYNLLNPMISESGYVHVVASSQQNGAPLVLGVTTPVTGYRANERVYRQGNRTR